MRVVAAILAFCTIAAPLAARDNALSPQEIQQGWILLFDGESLYGWSAQGAAQWRVDGGKLVADAGDAGSLRTNTSFADFDLTCDFLIKADGKSGIYLRTDKDGDPEAGGYKLQIDNQNAKFPTGSLAGQIKASAISAVPNLWHTYAVEAVGDHFLVKLDGHAILGGDGHKNKVGRIGLQFVPGTPVQFRNVKLRPLGLGDIFNGKTLYQWSEVGTPAAPKKKGALKKLIPVGGGGGHPSEWSVEDGAIHVKKGPTELESGAAYDDFVLQVDVQANAHKSKQHPSGGIFIRADKAAPHTGYEVQIHNEGNNAGQPVGPGTGGLANMHARRMVSADDQFCKLTVVATGHHISTWINGYQTADYEDTRADGPDALIQARTLAGPIRLAADDASSSLDFKSIAVVTLPKSNPPPMAAQAPPGAPSVAPPPTPGVPAAAAPPAMALPGAPTAPAANPHQKEIDSALQQAVATNDPAQQVKLYDHILSLDPGNQVAYSRRTDAQAKLGQLQAQQAQEEQQKAAQDAAEKQQQEQASTNEATKDQEVQLARAAILAGNLAGAAAHVALAKKAAPTDAAVLELDALVRSQQKTKWRERWLAIGLGSVLLLAIIGAVWMSLGKRQPFLEIVDGVDAGKLFSLNQEVTHIGAVAQDGGKKNEVVIKDLDRSISRFHCEVHRQNGKFWVLDCNSSNGTFLNGHRVKPDKPVLLKKSSRLQLAEACTLRLRYAKAPAKES